MGTGGAYEARLDVQLMEAASVRALLTRETIFFSVGVRVIAAEAVAGRATSVVRMATARNSASLDFMAHPRAELCHTD